MNRALGSNRAEYSRRHELQLMIRMAQSSMGRVLTDTRYMKLPELKQLWHDTYKDGQQAGIFKQRDAA